MLTGLEFGNVDKVVYKFQTASSPVGVLSPESCHFRALKNLNGKLFATNAYVKRAATSKLEIRVTNFFFAGIQGLVSRWDKRLKVSGDYVLV